MRHLGARALLSAAILGLGSGLARPAAPATPPGDPSTSREFFSTVSVLAADSMEGRGLETKGIRMAAGYLEKRLRASHLKPAFGQSYRQRFPVKVGISLGRGNRVSASLGGASATILDSTSWTPLGFTIM